VQGMRLGVAGRGGAGWDGGGGGKVEGGGVLHS